MTKKDTMTINETEDAIEIKMRIYSLRPCVNAIKEYNPSFKVKDIFKIYPHLKSQEIDSITEMFNDCLYSHISGNESNGEY